MPHLTVVGGAGMSASRWCFAFYRGGLTVNVNDPQRGGVDVAGSASCHSSSTARRLCCQRAGEQSAGLHVGAGTRSPAAVRSIVTIGTPVDEFLNPVQAAVQHCIDGLLPSCPTASC